MNTCIFRKVTIIILLFSSFVILNAQNWDIETLHKINNIESTKGVSTFVSESAPQVEIAIPIAMGVTALITKDDYMLKSSIYSSVSLIVNEVLTSRLKELFNRPRPVVSYPELINAYRQMQDKSFPSGHTSSAFSIATSLTFRYPKWYVAVPAYLWAGSVGFSRMNLGVHYPTDVMAGAVLGAGSAYATGLLNNYVWKKAHNKRLLSNLDNWNSSDL